MLKHRIITALILMALLFSTLFLLSPIYFLGLSTLIMLLSAWEWANLSGVARVWQKAGYLIAMLAVMVAITFYPKPLMLWLGAAWWCVAFVLLFLYPRMRFFSALPVLVRLSLGGVALLPCWYALNTLNIMGGFGLLYLLLLFSWIWAADIGAYFAGRRFGRTLLAPHLSPKKSWQGVLGGLLSVLLVFVLEFVTLLHPFSLAGKAVLGGFAFLVFVLSVLGDLFESLLKREANVKDSGALLPGHGGILDRIDSLLPAAPFFVLGLMLLGL